MLRKPPARASDEIVWPPSGVVRWSRWSSLGCRLAAVVCVLLLGGLLPHGPYAAVAGTTCSATTSVLRTWHPFTRCGAATSAPMGPATRAVITTPDPLAGQHLYVVPDNPAQQAAAQHPTDAGQLARIATESTAMWITDTVDLSLVGHYSQDAAAHRQLPTFVLYAIPERDCGSYSAGGFVTAQQYVRFVNAIKAELAGRPTIVIIEPDALPELRTCGLTQAQQTERLQLIHDAAQTLSSRTVHVYLEAGGSYSGSAAAMASVLKAAGIADASGFALDVSGFDSTGSEVSYGSRLSALVAGKHFVVDTSRNGKGVPKGTPRGAFCNVPGLALGSDPTTRTGSPLADAYLWVKYPGQSDGACGGGAPRSGVFWLSYALQLVKNAS